MEPQIIEEYPLHLGLSVEIIRLAKEYEDNVIGILWMVMCGDHVISTTRDPFEARRDALCLRDEQLALTMDGYV